MVGAVRMAKSSKISISFCAAFSVVLVLAVACLLVVLRRDNTGTETVAETIENFQEPEVKPNNNSSITLNSSSTIELHSTQKPHHHHKQFCRKCCHTPPCWYNNHKECSKCVKKEQLKHYVKRILTRSHKKATHQHRWTQKDISKK